MAAPKGNKFASGGARAGSGRKPEWLKQKCIKILKEKKLVEFLGEVAEGKSIVPVCVNGKEIAKSPAEVKDRLKAVEMLLDRGFGRPAQEIVGEDGGPIMFKMVNYSDMKKDKCEK